MDKHSLPRSRLGEILVRNGSITEAQLALALTEQARLKLPIGQTLLAMRVVTDEVMRLALGAQLNVPYIDLDRVVIDRSLANRVDRDFAERHLLMPVAQIGPTLTVAMDDPTATSVVEELAAATGFTINVVTSSGEAIRSAFRRVYAEGPAPAEKRPTVSLSLEWAGDLKFRSSPGQPAIELDSSTPGVPSPPQALAYAVMACMAMDVVHVLKKGRHDLRAMTITCEAERAAEHPRRFVAMRLHFNLTGRVDDHVVSRAIELSRTRYCSVWNSLRPDIVFETTFTVHD